MKDYLKFIDTNTPGPRCDVTPLFANSDALAALVDDLTKPFEELDVKYVAGIDALGFILGMAAAMYLNKGFVSIRKGGKLPVPVISRQFTDYSGMEKTLELRTDIITPGDRVLLVDEWIETGTQVSVAIELMEELGAEVIGIASINMDDNLITRKLREQYFCHTIWQDGKSHP